MITDALHTVRTQVARWRSIMRVLESDNFHRAYETATQEQKKVALAIIGMGDNDKLIAWVRDTSRVDASIRVLRKRAQRVGLSGYSRMDKAALLAALESHNAKSNQGVVRQDAGVVAGQRPANVGTIVQRETLGGP